MSAIPRWLTWGIPWTGLVLAAIAFYFRREWFLVSVKRRYHVDLARDEDRFGQSIREQRILNGDEPMAVTLRYFGPRPVTIVDIGFRLSDTVFLSRQAIAPRTLHNRYVERWLIPTHLFDPKDVIAIVLVRDTGARVVKKMNWRRRFKLWNLNRRFKRLAKDQNLMRRKATLR